MSEQTFYQHWLSSKEHESELLCRHCGSCCGAVEDPCADLMITREGKSFCRVYDTRFGQHQTVSGKTFTCVPVRQKMGTTWPGDERCGYKTNASYIVGKQ